MENNNHNTTSGLVEAIEQLDVHDHLCLIYETHEEQFAAVIPFIHIGLERNEKCIYIADDNTAEAVLHTMQSYGIDVDAATTSGQLIIANKKTAYLRQGFFDPDLMIQFLKENTELALKEGYSALRATGEMTWMLGGEPGVERLMEYEAKLNYFFPEHKALAICQYNLNKFRPEILKEVIETHPKVVVGGWVCKNFYYIPPDEFLHPEHPSNEIRRLLDNIISREAFEKTLINSKQELEKINEQLSDERKLLRNVLETLPVGVWIIDKDGKVTEGNQEGKNIWKGARLVGINEYGEYKGWWLKSGKKIEPQEWAAARAVTKGETSLNEEVEIECFDGTHKIIWNSAVPLRDAHGEISGAIVVNEDITARKQTEVTLAEQSRIMDAFFLYGVTPMAILDKEFNFLRVNSAYARACQREVSDFPGHNHFEFFPSDAQAIFEDVVKNKTVFQTLARPFVFPDHPEWGTTYWDWTLTPILDDDAEVQNLVFSLNNVTEREQASALLRESEDKFKYVFDHSLIGKSITFPDGRINVNRAFCEMVGYSQEELSNLKWQDITHPEDIAENQKILEPLFSGKIDSARFVKRYIHKNGSVVWADLSTTIRRDYEGKPMYFMTSVSDITERKRAEELLKRSESDLQSAQHIAHVGSWRWDIATNSITWSNELYRLFGLDPQMPPPNYEGLSKLYTDETWTLHNQLVSRAIERGESYEAEFEFIRADGTHGWLIARAEARRDSNGNVIQLQGTAQDITERKHANIALRRSQKEWRDIFNAIGHPTFILDPNHTLIGANPAALKLLNKSEHEVLGKKCFEIMHDPPVTPDNCPMSALLRCNSNETTESEMLTATGTFLVSCTPVLDEQGRIEKVIHIAMDITQRRKMEEALRASEEKYRDIVTWAPIGIYQSTSEGKFITANARLVEILGYNSIEELMVRWLPTDVYLNESDRKKFLAQYDYPDSDSVSNLEVLWKKKDGTPIWISLTAHAVRNEQNQTLYYEGFVQDISERKAMEEKRKSLEAQLSQTQKLEAIGTLASGIAHDFNNILGIILGYNSLLRQRSPSRELIEKSSEVIEGAVNRGAGLVKQILTFARQTEIHFGPLDINIISKEISKMLAETFPKTIVINLQLEKDLPTIHADPTQVHQVLLNICVNARDAMSSSGTLTLQTRQLSADEITSYFQNVTDKHYLLLSISDTGCGMSNETKGRIFEPFFTTKEKGKGTGLGLSVVYGIMKSHNGFVRVESELGKGTTFFLYFPIPKKTDEPATRTNNHEEQFAGGSETVFLVEDEVVLSELTKAFLEMNGYRVLTAKDGEEAIELYKKHHATIDIVVTDMGLPKLTGLEVLVEMKKIKPETKLIFASGYIEPELKSLMFQQGAKFFLFKPYQPNEILKVIRKTLDEQ